MRCGAVLAPRVEQAFLQRGRVTAGSPRCPTAAPGSAVMRALVGVEGSADLGQRSAQFALLPAAGGHLGHGQGRIRQHRAWRRPPSSRSG